MLIDKGYTVYCVNPGYDEIDGMKCYHTIEELPESPDVVDVVVSTKVSRPILANLDSSKIKNLWFQPGAFDDELAAYAKELGFNIVADGSCVMVALTLMKGDDQK
jgi:predicted CoA-binding protein